MTTPNNAARLAVEAAAYPKQAAAKPRDVFDCIAAGIPREQWEAALGHDDARKWNSWLGHEARQPSMLEMHDMQLQAAQQAQRQERITEGISNLEEGMWHLEAAGSALSAVWQLTDTCAFHAGSTLDLPAQNMAHLLKALHSEIARRTDDVNEIAKALRCAWREKA